MVLHVLDAARTVQAERTVVVLGHGHEQVRPLLPPGVMVAMQEQQLGTGHAVLTAAREVLPGPMLVLPGDTPLVTGEALRVLVDDHFRARVAATVLTMDLDDPTGYGRIVRAADGSLLRIVEHRDATPDELALHEVNTSMYVLPAPEAFEILGEVRSENDQGEIYLTDVIAGLRARREKVAASRIADPTLVLGVNSQEELAEADRLMCLRRRAEGPQE
jgi:bifunctional UDP-N-acetylglucosamine pyrophosphorylase/glucosamine-1-phosphate N-acetyltransferase